MTQNEVGGDIDEEVAMLLIAFGLGVVIGVAIVMGLLRLTATTNPAGCMLVFGGFFFLLFWFLLVMPWFLWVD
ncbi:MAG: hypothetical protein BroJett011_07770 [Chloroflexota bacterium]|nr:MAG: hypothetical protein BroJett011_07770 [Chloroflexota bacterium]